jgi:hypothetical protein
MNRGIERNVFSGSKSTFAKRSISVMILSPIIKGSVGKSVARLDEK